MKVSLGAMLPSGNDGGHYGSPYFLVVGTPGDWRVELFQAALGDLGLPRACLVPYDALLSGRVTLPDVISPGAIVRVESPGKGFEVERLLLVAGADAAEGVAITHIPRLVAQQLPFDKGRILSSHQWYLGLCRILDLIDSQLAACPDHRLMNRPADIKVMFDKPRCHERLHQSGLPVPMGLGPVRSFDELVTRMAQTGSTRVFVKLAYGSSASGIVAYQTDGRRHRAITTVEMVRRDSDLILYNTRHIRVHHDPHNIAELIDALCRHPIHVERWLPKADLDGHVFDLRMVVIAARVQHVVVRQSQTPMTNLHLLNARGDLETVLGRMGMDAWDDARRTCERAMACFPDSLYAGIDLLITSDYRRHAILEVNAFGDLLPGVLYNGLDTYSAEIRAVLEGTDD